MKEKDLEKCLDNLIIKGLIQEAEQDNAELEAALREMSEEDFLSLIYEADEEPIAAAAFSMDTASYEKDIVVPHRAARRVLLSDANSAIDEWDEWENTVPLNKSKYATPGNKGWKIWAGAIASIAAILLIVFIPAHMYMNSRICESALLVSEAYMEPSRGRDISSMTKEEVRDILPELEMQYSASLKREEGMQNIETPEGKEKEYYQVISDPQEAGMELVQAYLRLNKKDKAIEVLKQLCDKYGDSEFGEQYKNLLEIIE